jgi:hypothetical protein
LSYQANSREPSFSRASLWTTVHLYTGIVCANLPPSWPLISRVARLSTGSWVRLSSVGKRWYSPGSDHSSKERETNKGRDHDRPADVEVGRVPAVDYELDMYGRHGRITDDRVQSRSHICQPSRSEASLSGDSRNMDWQTLSSARL